jgi:signal transduction histidine kinase
LEAVRRQVATDLHDDLGSGLAQVAVLSEVAKRQAPPLAGALDEIGGLARSMRESLSDIVWAVDPTKDTLAAVVNRLRQVAANLFGDGTASVRFAAPAGAAMDAIALRPDRRRHLFLFCKEALTNAARHAQARTVAIEVARTAAGLRVEVADDGRGFDPAAGEAGNGLRSLRARAAALGADFTLRSAPGRGTAIRLLLPLA